MLTLEQAVDVYHGRLTYAKTRLMEYLEADGYTFIANDFRTMDLAKKWERHNVIQVASANTARPRYLWAVKGMEEQGQ